MAPNPEELARMLQKARAQTASRAARQLGSKARAAKAAGRDGFQTGGVGSEPGGSVAGSGPSAHPPVRGSGSELWGLGAAPRGTERGSELPAERLDALLDVAARLFSEKEPQDVTLEEVALEARIPTHELYSVARSRQGLLHKVVSREVSRFQEVGGGWFAELAELPFEEIFTEAAGRSMEYLLRHSLLVQLAFGLLSEAFSGWEAQMAELQDGCSRIVAGVIEAGQAQGAIRADLDGERVGRILWDLHLSAYLQLGRPTPEGLAQAEARRRTAIDMVVNGIRAR